MSQYRIPITSFSSFPTQIYFSSVTVETKILSSSFATWKYQRSMLPRFHSAISFYEKGFLWADHKFKTSQIFYIHFNSKIFCQIEVCPHINFKPIFFHLDLFFVLCSWIIFWTIKLRLIYINGNLEIFTLIEPII